MSVCIAAICREKRGKKRVPKIFAICDRKASSVEFSNEDAVVKGYRFHPNWLAMFAGNDVSPCKPILRVIQADLVIHKRPLLEQVKNSFEKYYQLYLSNLATSQILGRYKLSMEEFLEKGRKRFGQDLFDSLVANIERVKLQCQFLVCGFDGPPEYPFAHIFTVKNPGYVEDRSLTPGYWAIGNGDYAAMSTLGFFQQNLHRSLGTTYYNVMSAKFMAEKATHEVGEKSLYWQLGSEGMEEADGGLEIYIRSLWEILGKPAAPEWFLNDLDAVLKSRSASKELGAKLKKRQKTGQRVERWSKREKRMLSAKLRSL
jgi:hypothetical protein